MSLAPSFHHPRLPCCVALPAHPDHKRKLHFVVSQIQIGQWFLPLPHQDKLVSFHQLSPISSQNRLNHSLFPCKPTQPSVNFEQKYQALLTKTRSSLLRHLFRDFDFLTHRHGRDKSKAIFPLTDTSRSNRISFSKIWSIFERFQDTFRGKLHLRYHISPSTSFCHLYFGTLSCYANIFCPIPSSLCHCATPPQPLPLWLGWIHLSFSSKARIFLTGFREYICACWHRITISWT